MVTATIRKVLLTLHKIAEQINSADAKSRDADLNVRYVVKWHHLHIIWHYLLVQSLSELSILSPVRNQRVY